MNFRFLSRVKNNYKISDTKIFQEIVEYNRNTLSLVDNWLPEEVKKTSYFQYGVPDEVAGLLDLKINNEETYTDLILYYSRFLNNISYLELGVSVGKNFLQIANYLENVSLIGFDIENINPVLEANFEMIDDKKWSTMVGSIREEMSSLKTYTYKRNKIGYLAGDIWDEASWAVLKGQKFNIIFSDALHTPEALKWEYEMITKYDLLADDFIFFWDDLNSGLEFSFKHIADALKSSGRLNGGQVYLIKINGWLGQNYPLKHDIGIITNLRLK